jgi:hypothetical protein
MEMLAIYVDAKSDPTKKAVSKSNTVSLNYNPDV